MRVLYVVQRYGETIAGGAEQHCRDFAERLVARGHTVAVATTCASSYVDWANVFDPGTETINGVKVHRFPVAEARDNVLFSRLDQRMRSASRTRPRELQREWMRMQGPWTPDLVAHLPHLGRTYDCVVFVTYLYWTTYAGLGAIGGSMPTLLHPTAHDEPPLRMSIFEEVFRRPDAFAYLTPEESELVACRFPGAPGGAVVGIGTDLDSVADGAEFRREYDLADKLYLAYVGRVDPAKGAAELLDFWIAYKERNPSELALVFVGETVVPVPDRHDIVVTGFVDKAVRDSAMAGALALVQPSYFESFSMVLTEAFAQRTPVLLQRRSRVMLGHARRSNAALGYAGFAEFEASVQLLLEQPDIARRMGENARAYVERNYDWAVVLDNYEELLGQVGRHEPIAASGRSS